MASLTPRNRSAAANQGWRPNYPSLKRRRNARRRPAIGPAIRKPPARDRYRRDPVGTTPVADELARKQSGGFRHRLWGLTPASTRVAGARPAQDISPGSATSRRWY